MGETQEAGGQKDAHAQEDARILAEVGEVNTFCVFFFGGRGGGVKRVESGKVSLLVGLWKTSNFNMVDRVLYLPNECFT